MCSVFLLTFVFQFSTFFFCVFYVPRSKEVDWQPYFTTRLVDDFATHLRVFRKAQDRLADREDKQSEQTHSNTLASSLTVVIIMFGKCDLIQLVFNNDCNHVVLSLIRVW